MNTDPLSVIIGMGRSLIVMVAASTALRVELDYGKLYPENEFFLSMMFSLPPLGGDSESKSFWMTSCCPMSIGDVE